MRLREGEVGHVWPAKRAVDGEEAEAGELEAVEVVVHVRDPLVGLLRRAVERGLLVDAVLLRKGNLAEEGEGRRERGGRRGWLRRAGCGGAGCGGRCSRAVHGRKV